MRSSRPHPALFAALFAGALAASSCGESWRPVTFVEGLRVLGIQAEPPDLNPGGTARLSALLVDPSAPARENFVLWIACDPDPLQLDQPLCAKFSALTDPGELIGEDGALPEGVTFIGMGDEAVYRAPEALFAPVPADDPVRRRGLVAIVVMLAIGAPPPEVFPPPEEELTRLMLRVRLGEIPSVLAIKRLRISEESALNANPAIAGVRFDGELWGPGLRPVKLRPGQAYALSGEAAEGAAERYVQLDPDGLPVEKDEGLLFSWFSTLGDFGDARTPAGDASQRFVVPWPFDALPADRRASMYLVLRDGRGGASWARRGLFVCDPFLEPPTIAAIDPPLAGPADTITIWGSGLDRVIDVRLGSGWLSNVRYDAERGALTGAVPSDAPAGPQQLVVRGESCLPDPAATLEIAVE